jgi:two-component system CheB/CheR fusion protein
MGETIRARTSTVRGSAPSRRKKTVAPSAARDEKRDDASAPFPIVGIGASAGGLEALEQFLGHVPPASGTAFIIVQHLDPTRKGLMPELLQRMTKMKVVQVRDRTRVRPNCVYVIPPGKEMSILRGVLHLFAPTAARGLRLPIDTFLRSLALDCQQRSIGVILSGMGSDGTLGLRAIKEAAGVALVQDPTTAKFDSMPRNAIDAGLADIVAPAEELPGRIAAYLLRTPHAVAADRTMTGRMQNAMDKAVILLRVHTGHDFSLYKKNTLSRRIERRMGLHQIDDMTAYVKYLQANPQELDLLFKELLIGVTSFFRDPAAWQELRARILPALVAARPDGALRAWVAGCSTGEEAYSLAMVFKETLDALKPAGRHTLQIFATDLDRDAIDKARLGAYPENIAADVSPERLARFFSKEGSGYRVKNEIREMVVFAPHNLILDPPFTRLDILSCRNLLIYLESALQKKLLPLFHYSLLEDGVLFLGGAETVGGFTDLFEPLSPKSRIFRRSRSANRSEPLEFPSSFAPRAGAGARAGQPSAASLQATADQMVLQRLAPPAVLVNDKGDILYVSGRTGAYLEPAAGKANWNVFAMAREGLNYELTGALRKARRQKDPVTVRGIKVASDDRRHNVDITVQRLDEPDALSGLLMIVFTDVPVPAEPRSSGRSRATTARSAHVTELESELRHARTELQSTREVMQRSQEDLKSANEEMQSTNEELQSTNEELTTAKEEMQSMNEELQTVNHELQGRVDELSRANNDMKNLLNSTDIATLFLDDEMRVRRFTTQAAKIIKLIPGDVGRPITDLASDLLYPELVADVREVLRTLGSTEKPVAVRDGAWFTVRIMPYRTLDNRIDGAVITFSDITVAKTLEAKLREKQAVLERHVARQSGQMERVRARADAVRRSADQESGAS